MLLPVLELALPRAVGDVATGTHMELVALLGGESLANKAAEGTALKVVFRDVGDCRIVIGRMDSVEFVSNYVGIGLSEMKECCEHLYYDISTKLRVFSFARYEAATKHIIHVAGGWNSTACENQPEYVMCSITESP